MPLPTILHPSGRNRLLSALPPEESERLSPYLERLHLPQGRVLYECGDAARYAYFPLNGMVSLLSISENGETVEVAMIGAEGMVGLPIILRANVMPYRSMVQISCDLMRVRADMLWKEFNRSGRLQDLLLRYTHATLTQISQSALCNRFHTVEKRLCRWLLITRDRVEMDTFPLTQEIISHMLGTPRTRVTQAACSLQDAGLIHYRRGRITILSRQKLEAGSCECYQVVRGEIDAFLAA